MTVARDSAFNNRKRVQRNFAIVLRQIEVNMIIDQVVAIIGASSGIGRATALLLAQGGAKVVLGARHEDGLASLTEEITAAGGRAAYRVTDVSRREDLHSLVAHAQDSFGRLDVLFSNAGAMPIGPFDDLAVDDWETMVDVNIKGVLFGKAAALPVFRKQGSGHFIHMASTAARQSGSLCGHEGGGPRPLRWSSPGAGGTDKSQHPPARFYRHGFQRAREEP